mmetsp:Transcript_17260/g.35428  ORF Transcript_17260/g.35428 Transcript_17260/m.35428 type:complete len:241 (-) Transcript_17260:148-870(-)|eukprot:CAMPEP_0183321240 /NCGR_PEP_ID=MMETSP0160_2-20130417/68379_1 /TAXON_ID=2839 ORGANISM="Odontella Sinensis, Strain Grunow 1884" /NCGR_SAMPLE_ID=MMETSP0160_2 /ASSEMBLY_ACC=CAM_ASM_000250 /LENGTH=240 /DNA_ID=CAMNT_0025488123 /DNA_START=68 /DNA_END=790 /DNA_ORIENTATION=+
MSSSPIGQRKTGRRAQRRQDRRDQTKEGIDGDVVENASGPRLRASRHAPSAEIQDQIDAAILERSGKGSVSSSFPQQSDHVNNTADHSEPSIPQGAKYEYLDHTADVQLHSWGDNLSEALCQIAVAMFGYMTSLETVEIDALSSQNVASNVVARGHDLQSLVFSFLDEWLFVFHDTGFIAKEVEVNHFDRESLVVHSYGKGELMDLRKHQQGTEVKAVTYSNLQIREEDGRTDLWVIVDI